MIVSKILLENKFAGGSGAKRNYPPKFEHDFVDKYFSKSTRPH